MPTLQEWDSGRPNLSMQDPSLRGLAYPMVLIFLALSPKTAAPLFLDFGKGGDIKCFPREILELLTQGAVGKKKSTNSWPQAPTL